MRGERAHGHGWMRRVACTGGGSAWRRLRSRRRDRRPDAGPGALLESLESQTHRAFRVVIVDQNSDDRVERLLGAHPSLRTVHLLSDRGLSRARNRALSSLAGDVIGFPDDDCRYPPDLLERVARRFAEDAELGGLSGRPVAADGSTVGRWPRQPEPITSDNVWHRANSHTIFLRREVVERVGASTRRSGSAPGRRGRRARRSTTSYVRSAAGRGSNTTRPSWSRIRSSP